MESEKGSIRRAVIFLLLAATPVGIALAIAIRQVQVHRQIQQPIVDEAEGAKNGTGF